jgi:hypothetical protein
MNSMTGKSLSAFRNFCQASYQKYFSLPEFRFPLYIAPSRTPQEGRCASSRYRWARDAMAACWRQVIDSPGRNGSSRTAKSCGPGAATLASIPAGLCWRGNGDNKGRSPGRARISRKPLARGKPGCPGCTCGSTRVPFATGLSHTGLRAQSAPGFPCAL